MTRRSRAGVAARLLAVDALVRIEDGAFAHVVLPSMLRASDLDPRDRAFVTDLVYGTVRGRRRIDDLLARVLRRPLDDLDPAVRAGVRLGAYQLLGETAPHAAVGATVEAVAARVGAARGFTNGVLRALTRLGPPWPEPEGDARRRLAVATSHPDWIVDRLVDEFGPDEAAAVLRAANEPAGVTLRPQRRRVTAAEVAARLRADGVAVEPGRLVPDALAVRGTGDPAALGVVAEGLATPQDEGSQAVVDVVAPRRGARVLDVGAAPGGKATALAERVGPAGLVVALDVHPGRTRLVARAAHRLGLAPPVAPVVADGRAPPLRPDAFDVVLVDAPCTGLGVLRRRPDARWRVTPDAEDALHVLQCELLAAAAVHVRPGGRLVYSVCTFTATETRAVDRWAERALPAFAPAPRPGPPWRPHGRGALLLPSAAGTDGMYVLALARGPDPGPARGAAG